MVTKTNRAIQQYPKYTQIFGTLQLNSFANSLLCEQKTFVPNNNYRPVKITKDMDFRVLDVVTWVVRKTA